MKNSRLFVSEKEVADVLKHLWDLPRLGNHPLVRLASVRRLVAPGKSVSHLELGSALNQTIRTAVQMLQSQIPDASRPEVRYYLVLHYTFIEGESRAKVTRRLGISRRTYYRDLHKGVAVVQQILNDGELEGPTEEGSQ